MLVVLDYSKSKKRFVHSSNLCFLNFYYFLKKIAIAIDIIANPHVINKPLTKKLLASLPHLIKSTATQLYTIRAITTNNTFDILSEAVC